MDLFAYPLLVPENGETVDGFINRFIHDEGMGRIFDSTEQRLAVAYVQWGRGFITYKNAKPGNDIIRSKFVTTHINAEHETVETQSQQEAQQTTPVEEVVKQSTPFTKMMGYASVSSIQDLEHDIIMPGAWQKTINERVKSGKVPLMTKHLMDGGLSTDTIGYMNASSREDNVGLFAIFDILNTTLAQECCKIAKSSVDVMKPMGLSVEFYPVEGKYEPNNFGGFTFHEVKLLQVTLTPTPCNELSSACVVKQANKIDPSVRRKWIACLSRYSLRTK